VNGNRNCNRDGRWSTIDKEQELFLLDLAGGTVGARRVGANSDATTIKKE